VEIKILEVRDVGTYIGVMAIRMKSDDQTQQYYFRRCGYPADGSSIMVMILSTGRATNDPYEWASLGFGLRTMQIAHDYIIREFGRLQDGEVVDVEHILGETSTAKVSERFPQKQKAQALEVTR